MSILSHWGRDKIVAILQSSFSNAFSWIKMFGFGFKFHWSFYHRVQLTISRHGLDNGLMTIRCQAIILTNSGLVYWRIYASVGLDELSVPWRRTDRSSTPSASYMRQWTEFGARPLPETRLINWTIGNKLQWNFNHNTKSLNEWRVFKILCNVRYIIQYKGNLVKEDKW